MTRSSCDRSFRAVRAQAAQAMRVQYKAKADVQSCPALLLGVPEQEQRDARVGHARPDFEVSSGDRVTFPSSLSCLSVVTQLFSSTIRLYVQHRGSITIVSR